APAIPMRFTSVGTPLPTHRPACLEFAVFFNLRGHPKPESMMSLQALSSIPLNHPSQILNALALLIALAGSWLLLANQRRRQQFKLRLTQGNFQEALMLAARHKV